MNKNKLIMGASIGNCVHVAGVAHFLSIAEMEGYETMFLGPAISIDELFVEIVKNKPSIVAVSYRLTPKNVEELLKEIVRRNQGLSYKPTWVFGGTKPVAHIAKEYGLFSYISDGTDDINDSIRFLRGDKTNKHEYIYGKNITERISENYPYPVLRHHFGLPSMEDTLKGIEEIAKSKVLDVISLGTDQNAQQYFFNKGKMQKHFDGAGGVPIRSKSDLILLKEATKFGNYPLIRCYSGTADVFEYASMLVETLDNAWSAIPLCWYNELDKRGPRSIEVSIKESQELIKWHAQKNIPVEINEPHHWALRDAHDVISVVMAYISAYNAKKLGVKEYIAQYMFNVPNGLSFPMDLARVLAMIELVESLQDENFTAYRQTRAGLPLFSADEDVAKGQLSATTFMQMAVRPHIMHVVAYCEADHAATAKEVISSSRIVKGVIKHSLENHFELGKDKTVLDRKEELIKEANVLIEFIKEQFKEYKDPLSNSTVIAECIKKGYIDAVHIVKNNKFKGTLTTKILDGKCVAIDKTTGKVLDEKKRLYKLLNENQ